MWTILLWLQFHTNSFPIMPLCNVWGHWTCRAKWGNYRKTSGYDFLASSCTLSHYNVQGPASCILERRTHDRKVQGSSPGRSGGRIFFSRVKFLCWLLFWYPFHPCVTAVARKRSRSFCQKCMWQVTAKHTYTLPMWLWMKWHCNLVHGWMVYTELALKWQHFTWHLPCNNHRALLVHHFRGY